MDPTFISLGGLLIWLLFVILLKWWVKNKSVGSPVVSASIEYSRRWEDPKYVNMIHATRLNEGEALGEILTKCECKTCTYKPPVAPKGHGGTSMARRTVFGTFCKEPLCRYTATGLNTYCHKHRALEVKTHTIFTKSGPKRVSPQELNDIINRAREKEHTDEVRSS